MRTTLTLDDDVAQLVADVVHREHRPMKQIINETLRAALSSRIPRHEPYRLIPHESAIQPGFDLAGFNRLSDELETSWIMEKARQSS